MNRRQLALRHIAAEARVRKLTAAKIERIWLDLGSYDREDLPRWLERVIPVVEAAQRQSVVVTDSYLAQAMDRRPLGIDPTDLPGRNAAPEDEWVRPMTKTWAALGGGKSWEEARRMGGAEAIRLSATDIQLAMRDTAFAIGQRDKNIFGWERVPNADACELCLIASTQRYTTDHLMPIHDRCGCGIAPLTSASDSIINRDLYRDLKDEKARRIQSTTVSVRENAELGPVLVKA